MAIKVIAQLREVKMSFYPPAWTWHHALRRPFQGCGEAGGCEG